MARQYPVLVFVRGAQRGSRVQLLKTMNVLGRDAACDVAVQDEYASRQHARVIVEDSRVRLVNTSPNGTRVNGQETASADLKTGDVIGIGLECEIRLEMAGPADAARPGPAPAVTAPLPGKSKAEAGAAAEPDSGKGEKPPRKKPTLVFWLGIYLAGMFLLFVVLKIITDTGKDMSGPSNTGLTEKLISEFFHEPLATTEAANDRMAKEALMAANQEYEMWASGTRGPEQLYPILKLYKQALAYQNAQFLQGEDQTRMEEIRTALIKEVLIAYRNGYAYQRQGRYQKAINEYMYITEKLVRDYRHPIYKQVRAHLRTARRELMRQKDRSGPTGW